MDLLDQVAIVTGSARGIGKTIALTLAEAGANLVISDLNVEAGKETVEEIKAAGRKAVWVEADVSQTDQATRLIETAQEELIIEKFKEFARGFAEVRTGNESGIKWADFVISLNGKRLKQVPQGKTFYKIKEKDFANYNPGERALIRAAEVFHQIFNSGTMTDGIYL